MPCLIHVTYPQFQFIVISVIELFCCNYRYLNIFASDYYFFLRNERREKSALKFTLIESLFLRLQREMLSNFLSLSDFFLIQYKTRKRPLNTIENFDTPHPCRRNSVFGRVRDQVVTGPIEKIWDQIRNHRHRITRMETYFEHFDFSHPYEHRVIECNNCKQTPPCTVSSPQFP